MTKKESYDLNNQGKYTKFKKVRIVKYDKGKKGWNLAITIPKEYLKDNLKEKLKGNSLNRTFKLKDLEEDINPIMEYVENKYIEGEQEPKVSLRKWKKGYRGEERKLEGILKDRSEKYKQRTNFINTNQEIDKILGVGIGRIRIKNIKGLSDGALFNYNRELLKEAMKQGDEDLLNLLAQENNIKKPKIKKRIVHNITFYSDNGEVIAEASIGNVTLKEITSLLNRVFPESEGIIDSGGIKRLKEKGIKINIKSKTLGEKNIGRIEVYTQLASRKG